MIEFTDKIWGIAISVMIPLELQPRWSTTRSRLIVPEVGEV